MRDVAYDREVVSLEKNLPSDVSVVFPEPLAPARMVSLGRFNGRARKSGKGISL